MGPEREARGDKMLSVPTQWRPEQRADIMGMLPGPGERGELHIGYIRDLAMGNEGEETIQTWLHWREDHWTRS